MADESLTSLLVRWEELFLQGQEISAQELCRDCPDLLEGVQAAILKIKGQQEALATDEPTALEATDLEVTAGSGKPNDGIPARIGPYEIVRELGRGGMGVVYQAWDPKLKRSVALKMILSGSFARADERQLFLREAEAVARLQHPNIVQIHEIDEHEGHPYITLEYVDGGSLADRLRESPLAPEEAARLCETLSQAMQAAHDQGIIHRDLKPANVLLSVVRSPSPAAGTALDQPRTTDHEPSTIPKIADFGLAKHLTQESESVTGAVKGTPSYMAPEQTVEKSTQISARTDVYALGAILYEMLTGRPPFRGATVLDTLAQVRNQEPVAPRALQPNVPRDLETICLKCLQKEPAKRYGSALELAEDLGRFERHEPIQARPVSRVERTWRWCRRKPAAAGLVAAAALLVIGGFTFLFWFQQDRARQNYEKALRDVAVLRERQQTEQSMRRDLEEASKLRKALHAQLRKPGGIRPLLNKPAAWESQIKQALAALSRAQARSSRVTGEIKSDVLNDMRNLQSQLDEDEADRKLALRLEKIRLDRSVIIDSRFDFATAAREYPKAFDDAQLKIEKGKLTELAALIEKSPIKEQLVSSLGDWAHVAYQNNQRELAARLLKLASTILPDPWLDKIRDPAVWEDKQQAARVMRILQAEAWKSLQKRGLSPQSWHLLATLAARLGDDSNAIGLLQQAQKIYPSDFWINVSLARSLRQSRPKDAVGFFRAALAIRPESGHAQAFLALALHFEGDTSGAMAAIKKALKMNPKYANCYDILAVILVRQKKSAEAIKTLEKAIELRPDFSSAYCNLALALNGQGDSIGAVEAAKKAIELDSDYATAYYNYGRILDDQGKAREAVKAYQKATELAPAFALAHNNLGLALWGQNDRTGAIKALQKAIEVDGTLARAYYNLGTVLMDDRKDISKAIVPFKKAIELRTQYPKAYANLGAVLFVLGQHKQAIKYLKTAIVQDKALTEAYVNLGRVLHAQKNDKEAISALSKAIDLSPKVAEAHYELGMILKSQHQFSAAISAFKKTIKFEPTDALAHGQLGEVYFLQKENNAALELFRKAVQLKPDYAAAHARVGTILNSQGNLAGEIAAYRRAVQADAKFAPAWANLGSALIRKKDWTGALAVLKKAIEVNSNDAISHYNIGKVWHAQNRWRDALDAYRRALKVNPQFAPAYHNIGWILTYKEKDLAGAYRAFKNAIAADPGLALAHSNLGLVLVAQNRLAEAVKALKKSINLDPKLAQSYFALGNVLRSQKDAKGAANAYETMLTLTPRDYRAWYNLGLARRMQKDLKGFAEACKKVIAINPNVAKAHAALGDALLSLGRFSEAHAATQRALQLAAVSDPLTPHYRKQLQHCKQLLDLEKKLRLVLTKKQTASAADKLRLAQLCVRYKKRYSDASRLYYDAFADKSKAAATLKTIHRYNAACTAALAAAGKGADPAKRDERMKLRRQALEWLEEHLHFWTEAVQGDKAKLVAYGADDHLTHWLKDPDLASIRDAKELSKLPKNEQKQLKKLWSVVKQLLKQARTRFIEIKLHGKVTVTAPIQKHPVIFDAGKTYVVNMESREFDSFLRLQDNKGKILAENDDFTPGKNLNARIIFTPTSSGAYHVIATSYQQRSRGAYTLRIREFIGKSKKANENGTKKSDEEQ